MTRKIGYMAKEFVRFEHVYNHYRAMTKRYASFYFAIQNMKNINGMYVHSVQYFMGLISDIYKKNKFTCPIKEDRERPYRSLIEHAYYHSSIDEIFRQNIVAATAEVYCNTCEGIS